MQFLIQLNYANPKFGDWGTEAWFLGSNNQAVGTSIVRITNDDMFQKAWSAEPADYWDLWSVVQVPEPGTLSLLVGGLLLLAWRARYRLAIPNCPDDSAKGPDDWKVVASQERRIVCPLKGLVDVYAIASPALRRS